ncbi:unnamed protein product [Sphagnum balticum]
MKEKLIKFALNLVRYPNAITFYFIDLVTTVVFKGNHEKTRNLLLRFGRMGRAGSCALICVIAGNKLYSGNAGDSLGLLVSSNKGDMRYEELNRFLNADNPEEQERLRLAFPA